MSPVFRLRGRPVRFSTSSGEAWWECDKLCVVTLPQGRPCSLSVEEPPRTAATTPLGEFFLGDKPGDEAGAVALSFCVGGCSARFARCARRLNQFAAFAASHSKFSAAE